MKRIPCILVLLLFLAGTALSQNNVGINDNNSSPKASAMLDVYSTTKGMLVPRIALTSTTSASPVTSPETSLLIYNTATTGDVTPGYYFWNGSKWVRLRAGTDPVQTLNAVSKSANATLLKTENMVFASGDITLTLPVITSTDDGLEITVKNVGAYTDLVTVAPQSTHTIDAVNSVNLTRWKGRTFVAKNASWIVKEKDTRTDNFLDIGKDASFTTIAEAVAFLDEHMSGPTVIRVGGGNYTITSTVTINLPYPLTIEGLSYGEAFITGTSAGSVMFDCQTETYIKMLVIRGAGTGSGTDAIHLSGTDEYYEMTDVSISNFDKGIVHTASNESWVFDANFDTIATSGVEIAAGTASNGITNISETDFNNCGKGINLLSGAAWTFAATNCNFYCNTGTQYGIFYNPTNFTNFKYISISNDGWNNIGIFIQGFDFSRTDGRDANAYIQNNLGMENKNPHFRINVLNNASTTTITTANTWYKANWTTTSSVPCSWLCVNNKVTYLPVNKRDVAMWISGNISVNNSSRTLGIAIVKNGVTSTRYGETTLRTTSSSSNQPYQFSTVVYLEDVAPGDYFELYLTSTTSSDVVKVIDVNWYSDSK